MHGFVDRNIVTNRARMSSEKQQMLQTFLHTLGLKQSPKFESDLRSQLHGYRLDHDPTKNDSEIAVTLKTARYIVPEDHAFDTIATLHCQHAHPGKK